MSAVGTRLRFLSHLSHRLPGTLTLRDGQLQTELKLEVSSSGGSLQDFARTITLRGPGDVLAMNPGAIARVEPPPGSNDFEPNYFPFMEFADPEFPWRYSLDGDAGDRRRPWLCLLVVSAEERQRLAEEDGVQLVTPVENGREMLQVTGDLLPDLASAWALAHVQLNRYEGEPIAEFIARAPDSHCSRLLCCRRLEPRTRYEAFLVPSYRAGCSALASGAPEATADPAWTAPARTDVVQLPIYHRWEFGTSEGGDFESLARALSPAAVSGLPIGTRAVDAGLMRATSGAPIHFPREGALAAPGFEEARPSYTSAIEPLPLTARLRASLNESLSAPADPGDDEPDPLVTFPAYGRHHRAVREVLPPGPTGWPRTSPWFHELNQDFRDRVAAGLGAAVVRNDQHAYVKECWRQVGKVRQANERVRLAAAGLRVGLALETKHLRPLDDVRFALLMAPYHGHVVTTARGSGVSYRRAFERSGLIRGVLSQAWKRIVHRAIGIEKLRPFEPYRKTCQRPCFPRRPVRRPDPQATKALGQIMKLIDRAAERIPGKTEVIPVTPVDTGATFRACFDLAASVRTGLTGIIRFNDGRELSAELEPIVVGPEIDTPMYRPLLKLSLDYLLPGIEFLPGNGVTLMVENRRFIESYMAGVNHEMIGELVWRRYPVDRAATVFRQFWESALPDPRPDIRPMHTWRGDLGRHAPAGVEPGLVLVVKGDLIRRYPGTIMYALKTTRRRGGRFEYWSEEYASGPPEMAPPTLIEPVFRAQVGADIQFVGFPLTLEQVRGPSRTAEYYFVLQENQDLPRFGLDVQSVEGRRPDLCMIPAGEGQDLGWADVAGALRGGYINEFSDALFRQSGSAATAASVAARTYQQPVRVAIHASHMLATE